MSADKGQLCESERIFGPNWTNHSDDLVECWTGYPDPFYLCGFHAQFL